MCIKTSDGLGAEGCACLVSVGVMLRGETVEAAKANPDVPFASIDDWADNDFDGETDAPNIKPLVFDTAQAAFLGGYAAAAFSETGKVGTFGGVNIPPVSIFMDGFAMGVDHFNEENGATVEVKGWDVASQNGQFTEEFAANDVAKQMAQGLIDQGADVLFPVGGPIYQSAAEAIRDSGGNVALMGVDADVFETDPSVADLLLVSGMKGIDVAVYDAVMEASTGDFSTEPFVGTLENGAVGLSPFHLSLIHISMCIRDRTSASRLRTNSIRFCSYEQFGRTVAQLKPLFAGARWDCACALTTFE